MALGGHSSSRSTVDGQRDLRVWDLSASWRGTTWLDLMDRRMQRGRHHEGRCELRGGRRFVAEKVREWRVATSSIQWESATSSVCMYVRFDSLEVSSTHGLCILTMTLRSCRSCVVAMCHHQVKVARARCALDQPFRRVSASSRSYCSCSRGTRRT